MEKIDSHEELLKLVASMGVVVELDPMPRSYFAVLSSSESAQKHSAEFTIPQTGLIGEDNVLDHLFQQMFPEIKFINIEHADMCLDVLIERNMSGRESLVIKGSDIRYCVPEEKPKKRRNNNCWDNYFATYNWKTFGDNITLKIFDLGCIKSSPQTLDRNINKVHNQLEKDLEEVRKTISKLEKRIERIHSALKLLF